MKSTKSIAIGLLLILLLTASAPAQQNPQQIAILRWYAANLTTTFPIGVPGFNPVSLAFDGENIWAAGQAPGLNLEAH